MVNEDGTPQVVIKTSQEIEDRLIGMFATIYSKTVVAMCEEYGPEALDVARQAFIKTIIETSKEGFVGIENRDLHTYVKWLTTDGTESSHKYETIEWTENSIRLRYLFCPWAVHFRKIGYPEIGKFFCDADSPIASLFNEDIKFDRTKTLMEGDDYCNHHFYVESY